MSSYLYGSYIKEATKNIEALNENNVCKNTKDNIFIAIAADPDRLFYLDPYFKVSWRSINRSSRNVARISMKDGDYIIHNNASVELPSKIVDKINNLLEGESYIDYKIVNKLKQIKSKEDDTSITVWDALVFACAEECNMPYNTLKESLKFKKINPNKDKLKSCNIIRWGDD